MQTFKDKAGGEWVIEITCGHRNILQARCDIDLFEPNVQWLAPLQLEIDRLLTVVYVLVEAQVKERGLDEMQWAMLIDAQAFANAQDAFLLELEDFFLNARRPFQMKAVQFTRARMVTAFEEAGLAIDREAEPMDRKLRQMFDDLSGSSRESSDSIQDRSSFENSSGPCVAEASTNGHIPASC